MGSHNSPAARFGAQPEEVTLARVGAALTGLGFDVIEAGDRLVVPTYAFIATAWISYDRPLMLAIDFTERIPIEFERSHELARFINRWNLEKVGPTASYRLMDSGDFQVSMRLGVHAKCGLTDEQIMAEAMDAFQHAAAFSTQLREGFLPIEFDQPLPPALARAQDTEALLGRHPSERHLPRGGHADAACAPDAFEAQADDPCEPIDLGSVGDTLDMLDFSYPPPDQGAITTSVNGIPYAFYVDAETYVRVAAMWETGCSFDVGFLPLWLACNDINEQFVGLRAYVLEDAGDLDLHVETTCIITEGLGAAQRHNFIISSLVSTLGAVDALSTDVRGTTAVQWPRH
ncbi:hypothetical protein [Corynebacterium liangguodongii]|uniref:Uncharacterized protein n=1 Tax=Corynebacterium liangguodongii TaxID=2079535 RepID=A0A2S0WEX0_9CORY|nr:hypothetical protein [Corynebacterium liangguodongii]AWB84318.1 hypothetical protein C3E79_07355 [Corynebacterium liangguodongii]PWB99808.1 hypothetical protein DF219_03950 [Corynebacterium liangguodongii]